MKLFMSIRVLVLLIILVAVASNHFLGQARLANWDRTLWITVYPIVADGQAVTRRYVESLEPRQFREIADFLTREAGRFGRSLSDPVHFQLAPVGHSVPPPPPAGANRVAIGLWSLKMRWWAWRQGGSDGLPDADVQLFVQYQAARNGVVLDRSLGMRKGRYGVVNAFATRGKAAANRVVLAHELLHVLGASDKYEPRTGQPLAPDGLAEPDRVPLYPQVRAELMGGRIADSPSRARMPESLRQCVVGATTAQEIGWF